MTARPEATMFRSCVEPARRFGSTHGPALYRETMMHVTDASNGAGLSNHRRAPLYRSSLWLGLIVAALPIAGCAGSGHRGNADGQLASEQSDSFVADNTLGGAATDAVVGCVAGILLDALLIVATHGGGGSLGIGCAVGGVAGAVAGGADGYTQGKEAQAQADRVLMTRSLTGDIEQENARLQSAVEAAQRVVDSDREKLDRIKSDLAAKTISLDNAQVQAAFIRQNTAAIAAIVDDARKRRVDFLAARKSLQGSDTAAVDRQIGQLDSEIAQLESQLASVNASLTLTELN
jgi:hypothetical protein